MDEVLAARAALSAADAAQRAATALSARREWLHDNERPSRGLTARLRPAAAPNIAALRTPSGGLAGTAQECADILAGHWAAVSAAPVTDPARQSAVLDALGEAPRVGAAQAAALSNVEVPPSEVAAAIRRMKSGTSPGPDGLPLEVYCPFTPSLPGFSKQLCGMSSCPRGSMTGS